MVGGATRGAGRTFRFIVVLHVLDGRSCASSVFHGEIFAHKPTRNQSRRPTAKVRVAHQTDAWFEEHPTEAKTITGKVTRPRRRAATRKRERDHQRQLSLDRLATTL